MPQISIITPVYIDEADKLTWLAEMIESVQAQTFTDWEMILIDDVSPMLIGAIRLRFQDEPRLRWLRSSYNQGPAMVRNTAVTLAESDCILPIDADDMLADVNVLQAMYDAWRQDQTKIIYGNLQRLTDQGNHWQRGKIIQFPDYTFERVMDLNGLIPVTAMHSIACHNAAGGWKNTLQFGLEDVEYWIAAGKAGYCGQRINHTTLVYRRHNTSRSHDLRYGNMNEDLMKRQIMDIHKDVYQGNFPMACCGKGTSNPASQSVQSQASRVQNAKVTTLDAFPEDQKVWVEYAGKRAASFQILGRTTRTDYRILGVGHKMQVHRDDLNIFRSLGRGQDFRIGIPAPTEEQPQAEVIEQPVPQPSADQPAIDLAEIERLDRVAAEARGIPIEPESPQPVSVVESPPPVIPEPLPIANGPGDLAVLGISEKIAQMLDAESWTIEKLAEANTTELLGYPGIGPARSKQIVDSAKKWLEQTH